MLKLPIDKLWSSGLLIAAIVLFTANLGGLPLRDWDEGLVAQVAREIAQAPLASLTWLYPTQWGEPYLNKPPLLHILIAATYTVAGVSEWTARLPGALLTALSVPLLYGIGREVFHRRSTAGFVALIYLTSLPVVRNGRLAMLDGAVLCFLMLTIGCTLRTRRDLRYAIGVGLGIALICLTKGIMVGLLLGAIALLFLRWDTPRLLALPYFWGALLLGNLPTALWYLAQWIHYGQGFVSNNLVDQSFQRIWSDVEQHGGAPWFYLIELVKYGAPWLLLLPMGIRLAWANRALSWAKLAIVWGGVYLIAISLMATKLPWYSLPLYPALALLAGAQLDDLWQHGRHTGMQPFPAPPYARIWMMLFLGLALVCGLGASYYGVWSSSPQLDLALMIAVFGITLAIVTVLLERQDAQFAAVLVWGTYLTLLLFVLSDHWIWELAEAYPVKPVAAIVRQHAPSGQTLYTSYPDRRPSLDFYSQHPVIPADQQQLRRLWRRQPSPYFLLDAPTLGALELRSVKALGTADGWTLITKPE